MIVLKIIGAALTVYLSGAASALAGDSRAEALADACTSCHGIGGRSAGYIPSLNTLSRAQFVQALADFRDQKRAATVMNRIMRAYTPTEIELLADYFTGPARQ